MTTYFDTIPASLKQTFTRIRRTTGGTVDSYGDSTFTETRTTGYKGFFQYKQKPYATVNIAGQEIDYDAIVYTGGTVVLVENDVIVFGGSTSTTVATRYRVQGINSVYEKGIVEHKEVYVETEIV